MSKCLSQFLLKIYICRNTCYDIKYINKIGMSPCRQRRTPMLIINQHKHIFGADIINYNRISMYSFRAQFLSAIYYQLCYITWTCVVRRPARARRAAQRALGAGLAEPRPERDARYCIKFRSYSVMFCPIASDLCVFRFFVINGLPGESTLSATWKRFIGYFDRFRGSETSYPVTEDVLSVSYAEFAVEVQYLEWYRLRPFATGTRRPLQLTASYARLL